MSYKNVGVAVLIGGFLYFLILIFLSLHGYTFFFEFFAKNWVAGAFTAVGLFFSIDEKNYHKINIVFSLLLILFFHYLIQLIIYRNFIGAFNGGFFRTAFFVLICGCAAAAGKLQNIKLKENPIISSPEIVFERAKSYKMNPIIRPMG